MKPPISHAVYDNIGNLERSETLSGVEGITNYYGSNPLNQYTNITGSTTNLPTYDDDGNMLTYGAWMYEWNGENRMIQASNESYVVTMAYDYMGRRFQKVVNGVTNNFIYDGWAMIQETSSAGTTNSYVYGLDLSGSLQGAGTIGGILSANFNGTNAYFCYDGNGNVTDLVDSNGNSLAHYEYSPFGVEVASSGSLADVNPFRFSTKYFDDKTEMNFYGYRYYHPEMGRWMNRDPIGEFGGVPLYVFVANNEYTGLDALGLQSKTATTTTPGDANKQLVPCPCDERSVDQAAAAATVAARGAMIRDVFPDGIHRNTPFSPPPYREHCAIVCCDTSTGTPYPVGPVKGHYLYMIGNQKNYKDEPNAVINGVKMVGRPTCGKAFDDDLECKKSADKVVRYVHTHPSINQLGQPPLVNPRFSPGDEGYGGCLTVTNPHPDSPILMLCNGRYYVIDLAGGRTDITDNYMRTLGE